MGRFRFTIRSIVWLVVFLGVAIASLRESNDAWDSGVFGLTILTLLTASLLAVHRSETARAFWLGFVLFGGVYLASSLLPPIESRLPTTKLLAFLDAQVPGRVKSWTVTFTTASPGGSTIVSSGTGMSAGTFLLNTAPANSNLVPAPVTAASAAQIWDLDSRYVASLFTSPVATTENFLRIGHSLTALLMAFIGGNLSRWIHVRKPGRAVPAAVMAELAPLPDREALA
jgi:hypothetical protein